MLRSKQFLIPLFLFIGLQIILYSYMVFRYDAVPFEKKLYFNDSHHYIQDPRASDGAFSLLRGLGVWDAQWYLRIADDGYPPREVFAQYAQEPRFMGGLTYAFFPFYPLILYLVNFVFNNIEFTAFIVSNILMIANFVSIYYIVTKLYSREVAVKTSFLLFLYPFSIFYRSYFTEGLFLLLLVWFSYFLIKHKWFYATVLVSLLFVTRPNGAFMGFIFLAALFFGVFKHKLSMWKAMFYLALSIIPFMLWCYHTYSLTGNPLYWHEVQSVWFKSQSMLHTFTGNLIHMASFFDYPTHSSRESRIDILSVIVAFVLLIVSRKFFKKYPQLWWISLVIWIAPLLLKDLMSYSRYQIISFPLFIFMASYVNGWKFYTLCGIFFALLLFTSLYFINWHWVG